MTYAQWTLFLPTGLANSTKATYKAGQKKYAQFARTIIFLKFYLLLKNCYVILFHIWVKRDWPIAYSTIKGYLAKVRNLQIRYGWLSPSDTPMPKLEQVLRGIKISQARASRLLKCKLPITPTILRRVKQVWSGIKTDYHQTLLWAAATTCFFGFLRCREITLKPNESFDLLTHLSFQDIAADSRSAPTFVQLTLKASKTDLFRQVIKIVFGATGDDLCLVDALFAYLHLRGDGDGPLFWRSDGSPLTRAAFIAGFRKALIEAGFLHQETSGYSGHSFRAGAASTVTAVGIEDSLIGTLGRWESSAYLIALHLPRDNTSHAFSQYISHLYLHGL